MQFYGKLLTEILGESAPPSKHVHLKQDATDWPKTIVTDARHVYGKLSTEKGGLPPQKALTLEIATIRELLVNSDAQIRWTADENMIMNGLTKNNKESRQHVSRVRQQRQTKCTTRRHAGSRKVSVAVKANTTTQLDAHSQG